jgi:hypothetical protein
MIDFKCVQCGKPFSMTKSRKKQREWNNNTIKYCSRECCGIAKKELALYKVKINDEEMTLPEVSKRYGVKYQTLLYRFTAGFPLEEMIKVPKYNQKEKMEKIKKDILNGKTYKEVMIDYGVSKSTVYNIRKSLRGEGI